MQVILTNRATKHFRHLPRQYVKRISAKIKVLSDNPYAGKLLDGKLQGCYSIRVWPYRIVYEIDIKRKQVWVISIVHRQGAYK